MKAGTKVKIYARVSSIPSMSPWDDGVVLQLNLTQQFIDVPKKEIVRLPKRKKVFDINKHIIGKTYSLTQENMNAMIKYIEETNKK